MGAVFKIQKWLRRTFPALYKRFGRYFHTYYKLERRILRDAKHHPERYDDPQMAAAVKYLSRNGVSVFSYSGCEKYDSLAVDVHTGDDGFPWVEHNGRRLYFRRDTDPARAASYYRGLLKEQDPASPHCYDREGFELGDGDVLFDVGSAEGIFALDNVEKASRIFLFEVDERWIGALERTFAPWKEKVVIINKFASDTDGAGTVAVDSIVREYGVEGPLFLKMDVEGAEESVIRGAAEALSGNDSRAIVCTYHRNGDHELLSDVMSGQGFDVATSAGHMLFVFDKALEPPFFRRGVIYCRK
jgi:hypothetical protein